MSKLVASLIVFSILLAAGWAVPPMKWERLMLMKAQAEKGDPEAQFLIGLQYRVGDGFERDPVEAAKWFRRAAEAGQAEAQFALAEGYATGQGVPQDYAAAMKWYRLSAGQGNAEAQLLVERIDALIKTESSREEVPLRPAEYTSEQSIPSASPELPATTTGITLEAPAASNRWNSLILGLLGSVPVLGLVYWRSKGSPSSRNGRRRPLAWLRRVWN